MKKLALIGLLALLFKSCGDGGQGTGRAFPSGWRNPEPKPDFVGFWTNCSHDGFDVIEGTNVTVSNESPQDLQNILNLDYFSLIQITKPGIPFKYYELVNSSTTFWHEKWHEPLFSMLWIIEMGEETFWTIYYVELEETWYIFFFATNEKTFGRFYNRTEDDNLGTILYSDLDSQGWCHRLDSGLLFITNPPYVPTCEML